MRTLLVPIDGSADSEALARSAFAIARENSAHVDALHVRPDPRDAVPLLGEGLSGDMIENMINAADTEAQTRADAARTLFETIAKAEGVTFVVGPGSESGVTTTWHDVSGREDEVVAWRGRLADLIVMARPGEDASAMRSLSLHAALFETGCGVLALPPSPEPLLSARKIAIAWNGTQPATRAVHAALDILGRAKEVHVLSCESERTDPSAAIELADYLKWRSITASVHEFAPGDRHIADALLDRAAEVNADLLVMGAYSHSRLLQTVLGGVTSIVLSDAKIPLLMAH